MSRRSETDRGGAPQARPKRRRRVRNEGEAAARPAPASGVGAEKSSRIAWALTVAAIAVFTLIEWVSATPYRLFPGDDRQAWEAARHRTTNPMPFTPTTQWVLRLFGALDSHVEDSPGILVASTLVCLSVTMLLLSRLAFRLTGSVTASVLAMALFATSGWTATYVHWWSYAPVTSMFVIGLFAALEHADAQPPRAWQPALVAGLCAGLCAGSSVSAMAAVGACVLVFGAQWWWRSALANAQRSVVFTAAFVGAALALFDWKEWAWHIHENLTSPHLVLATARFGSVPRPPMLPGLWTLWIYSPPMCVAWGACTVAALLWLRRGPEGPDSGALRRILAIVWLHLLIVDALPTTKLARTHYAVLPLVCLALALIARRSRTWLPPRLASRHTAVMLAGALAIVGHGLVVAHETWRLRHIGPRTMEQSSYRHRSVVMLLQDPHSGMLRQWLALDRTVLIVGVGSGAVRFEG